MPHQESPLHDDVDSVASSSPASYIRVLLDERREASRFKREGGTDFAVVWRDIGEEYVVEVHDESLTGLGIFVESHLELELEVGSRLRVMYTGQYMEGEVRHLRQEGERYRVGLECRRLPDENSGR